VDYYGASFLKHKDIAIKNGLDFDIYDSFNLSTDIDEVSDLPEILLHSEGEAFGYLKILVLSFPIMAEGWE